MSPTLISRKGSNPSDLKPEPGRDPYRGVVFVLLALALLGTFGALACNAMFADPLLLDTAVTLVIATGILLGVALAQISRARPAKSREAALEATAAASARISANQDASADANAPAEAEQPEDKIGMVRNATAAAGAAAILVALDLLDVAIPAPLVAGIVAALCLAGAGLCGTAARYLESVDPSRLPEAPGLCRGARVTAWILAVAALSCGLAWAGLQAIVHILHFAVLAIAAAVCYGLYRARQPRDGTPPVFPLDLTILSVLGARTNLLASVLDSAEAQLGIDLRSTWALTVVRRSLEPLVIGLCLLGWLSTSLTVVGVEEQGLVERLGVPVGGDRSRRGCICIGRGPWIACFAFPCKRVQALDRGPRGRGRKADPRTCCGPWSMPPTNTRCCSATAAI